MRREFLKGARDEDDAVVKAFAHHNRESALKTKPKVCLSLVYHLSSVISHLSSTTLHSRSGADIVINPWSFFIPSMVHH